MTTMWSPHGEGLRRVDVIRRVDVVSRPRGQSALHAGRAGLMRLAGGQRRAGQRAGAASPTTSRSPSSLSDSLLPGSRALLPNVPSYLCMFDEDRQYVLDHLDSWW